MAISVKKLTTSLKQVAYHHAPGDTAANIVGLVDMRDIMCIMVNVLRLVGTGALTLELVANTQSDGLGDGAVVKTITPAAAPDADGDYVFGELLAEEVRQKGTEDGKDYRYAGLQVTLATGTDELAVTYTGDPNRFCHEALSADFIS